MSELTELKAKRGALKAKLTRFRKYFDAVERETDLSEDIYSQIQVRLEKIEPLFDEFNELQSAIELLDTSDTGEVDRDSFEETYFKLIGEVKALLKAHESDSLHGNSVISSAHQSVNPNNSMHSLVKLPPISIPTFNGHYDQWLEFKDIFVALVHDNSMLTNIQKFYYLRASLEKEAAQIINSLQVSADNYNVAWKILNDRFENKSMIIYNHIRDIFEHPKLQKESHIDLRNLLDSFSKHLRALKALGEKTDEWDRLIIYILCNKFDAVTRRDWEGFKIAGDLPTLSDINIFLKQKCEILEKLENCKSSKFQNDSPINKKSRSYGLAAIDDKTSKNEVNQSTNSQSPTTGVNQVSPESAEISANGLICDDANAHGRGGRLEEGQEVLCDVARLGKTSQVLLSTAVVILESNGKLTKARAMMDSGSQSNFLSDKLCKELNLKRRHVEHVVKGVGQTVTNINQQVSLRIKSCNSDFESDVHCLVMPNIICKLPTVSFQKELINIPSFYNLADPDFNKAHDIDLLLGSDIFWRIMIPGYEVLGPELPILKNTSFGWLVSGNIGLNLSEDNKHTVNCNFTLDDDNSINNSVLKFWEIEEIGKNKILSNSEAYCEEYFAETVRRDETGRFIVKIPFKPTIKDLGSSKEIARRRYELLERRLNKDSNLKKEYNDFLREYRDLNHMSEINAENSEGYFLPHHAVVKKSSLTTKCRVVFDSSCKTDSGLSLNDVQYVGPTLQQDIFSILSRFRMHKFVMTADITKMYRQILIDEDLRKYQKIFWRPNESEDVKVFALNTVTYGNASSPYLAVKCLFSLSHEVEESYPLVSEIIRRDFYMDDLLTGAESEVEILEIQGQISNILSSAGFPLRKWLCNNDDILRKFELNETQDISVVQIGEGEQNKTLGIFWDSNNDLICYKININQASSLECMTKRAVLSVVCQIFDPLGLLGPVLTTAKLIIQELWKLKVGWDDEISKEIQKVWHEFQLDLENINLIKIPRHAIFSSYIELELHGFSDASIKAYGACVYVRCHLSSCKFVSHLLCAKSRVAPIKQVSLPRLELCGAVLLSNLIKKTINSLQLKFDKIYLWTDSTIVLAWIRGTPTRWKTFVANRVSEIQSLTNESDWRHVRSCDNPADLISRGALSVNLINNSLWWFGPDWFSIDNSQWCLEPDYMPEAIPEQRNIVSCVAVEADNFLNDLLCRFSSLKKILRVLALVLRFVSNIKNSANKQIGPLLPSEISNSLNVLIINAQLESFPQDYNALKNKKHLHKKK